VRQTAGGAAPAPDARPGSRGRRDGPARAVHHQKRHETAADTNGSNRRQTAATRPAGAADRDSFDAAAIDRDRTEAHVPAVPRLDVGVPGAVRRANLEAPAANAHGVAARPANADRVGVHDSGRPPCADRAVQQESAIADTNGRAGRADARFSADREVPAQHRNDADVRLARSPRGLEIEVEETAERPRVRHTGANARR
jgi:hypothetical protein